ncbi:hypothetical protein PVAND_003208 [Polypedilum vanderplanki]|uniref:Ionotropic receptor n=1 Tax=Polypedilum vanderplanki TaxID=319348 RepID=A0A9J6BTC3_POLVA|nr:hypothetical protein PVAND_003208 [Polypedilum vanderplanki]
MKIFTFLLSFLQLCESYSIFKNSTIIATALSDVIEEYFVRQKISYEFIIFGEKTNEILDVLDEVLKNENNSIKIRHISFKKSKKIIINESAIILGEPEYMKSFNNLTKVLTLFPKTIKLLIYTNNTSDFSSQNFLTILPADTGQFQYFLNENDNNIELQTFEWFDENICNKRFIKTLNTFNQKSKKWNKKLENYKKFTQFHQCMLSMFVGPTEYYTRLDRKLSNFAFDFMDIVGQKGNFSLYRQPWDDSKNTSVISFTPQIFARIENIAFFPKVGLHYIGTITDDVNNFIIAPAEPYTSYEKLIFPFDFITWCLLFVTFFIAFGAIFFINFMPKIFQTIVYGTRVTMPMLNVLRTFFGISQTRLPQASFPRFILIFFIFFCLIIRTAYQGVFFELLTTDMRKPLPETIDDLLDRNYTIFASNTSFSTYHFLEFVNRSKRNAYQENIELLEIDKLEKLMCSKFFNHNTRSALFSSTGLSLRINLLCRREPLRLEQIYQRSAVGIATLTNRFCSELLFDTLELIIPTGITNFWYDWHLWYKYKRYVVEIEPKLPQILTLNDLSFGFVIWLIACGICTICFFIELIVYYSKIALRNYAGLTFLFNILKNN